MISMFWQHTFSDHRPLYCVPPYKVCTFTCACTIYMTVQPHAIFLRLRCLLTVPCIQYDTYMHDLDIQGALATLLQVHDYLLWYMPIFYHSLLRWLDNVLEIEPISARQMQICSISLQRIDVVSNQVAPCVPIAERTGHHCPKRWTRQQVCTRPDPNICSGPYHVRHCFHHNLTRSLATRQSLWRSEFACSIAQTR